mgnify:CR=1 FL=1
MPCYKDEKTGTWYCQFRYADFTGKRKQKRKPASKPNVKRKSGSANSICKKPRAVT